MVRYPTHALLALVLLGSSVFAQSVQQTEVGAAIQVYEGTSAPPVMRALSHECQLDFGATSVATVVPKIFTVKNVGTADLVFRQEIHVPRGFTLERDVRAARLAPGQTTTFVIALNSAAAGRFKGEVSLRTNAANQNPLTLRVEGTAYGPPSMRIIVNGDIGFRTVGAWTPLPNQGFQGKSSYAPAGKGNHVASWTFKGLVPGNYRVSVNWTPGSNRAPDAKYTVLNGSTPFTPITVDQQGSPGDLRDAGTTWTSLGGPYQVTGDTLAVQLSDQASKGFVIAGAARIERLEQMGRIVDDTDMGFSTLGTWTRNVGEGFQGTQRVSTGGAASWNFTDLARGQYRISATWQPSAAAANHAVYTILENGKTIAKVPVNQQLPPKDLADAGTRWKDLGELGQLYTVTGGSLEVRLASPDPTEMVVADAIRIERIYNPAAGPSQASFADVVRFLEQATFGPNQATIDHIMIDLGGDLGAFIDEQVAADPSSYPSLPLVKNNQMLGCADLGNPPNCARDNYTTYPLQLQFFTNALYGPDQLRQRMAFALHQLIVVSGVEIRHPSQVSPYVQLLAADALGNYHDVLLDISLNPAMGKYLSMEGSTKTRPNENYGREVLQLFSIGLFELNNNGTFTTNPPTPTYDQSTVDEFARAFTGWRFAPRNPARDFPGTVNYLDPMVVNPNQHDTGAKTLLQRSSRHRTLPAGRTAPQDLNDTIDNIIFHPNVPPFVSKQLIQHFVTNNPPTGYISRVAEVFRNNGAGQRGDLAAVYRAILLDPIARGDRRTEPDYGKLREPTHYVCNILRAFNALSFDQTDFSDGYLNPQTILEGMDVFRPPSVFSYFAPGNEFQILSTSTAVKRTNFSDVMLRPNGAANNYGIPVSANAPKGTKLDLSPYVALADDPPALVDQLDALLLHGTMSDNMKNSIIMAVTAVNANNPLRRAKVAVYLATTSWQYQVQR